MKDECECSPELTNRPPAVSDTKVNQLISEIQQNKRGAGGSFWVAVTD